MKVLITGRHGQLAQCLLERGAGGGHELIALGRPELDLERPGSGAEAVRRIAPDVVINAAAYTAVDRAEDEPERAHRVNGAAPGELATAAREIGARFIQISTDYVFDGRSDRAYREDDAVSPLGVYGRSKLEGEERVRAESPNHVILRTAWVYSPFGHNFVRTMLEAAGKHDEVSVVGDQVGTPTSALDLAGAALDILASTPASAGTFHLAGASEMSWADLAERIFVESARLGGPVARVRRIGTTDWKTKAARPANSRLDSSKFARAFAHQAPSGFKSLQHVVARLLSGQSLDTSR